MKMFETHKDPTRILHGIAVWSQVAHLSKWIDEEGYLTKEGLKILKSTRYKLGFRYDKWDAYDEYHLSKHVKRIWKYLKYARTTFSPIPKGLEKDDWNYLNTVVSLENLKRSLSN